jgi:pimeloyl-ACP methyl ester carboxylesterase
VWRRTSARRIRLPSSFATDTIPEMRPFEAGRWASSTLQGVADAASASQGIPDPAGEGRDLEASGGAMRAEIATGAWVEYDDAGQGRPVVLLHAFPLSRAMWRPQLAELAADYRVIAPDLRGFGGTSPFTGPPSVEQMADDVAALLDALGVAEPLVLGGLSMGGYVALAFVRRHAARLRGLILADTRAEADSPEGKANRDRLIAFARANTPRDVIETMLPNLLGKTTRTQCPEVIAEVRQISAAQTPEGIIGALAALRDRPDSTPLLGSISLPVLVVVGGEDTLTPPALAQNLAATLPDARLATIEWAGHLANLEQPEAFNAAVRSFLQTLR